MRTTRIRFYAHKLCDENTTIQNRIKAADLVQATVHAVAKAFGGTASDGSPGSPSFQYDDTVEFNDISDSTLDLILRAYPFAVQLKFQHR